MEQLAEKVVADQLKSRTQRTSGWAEDWKKKTKRKWLFMWYRKLPGTIANLVPGGYWDPRGAINPVVLDSWGEATIKPWHKHTHRITLSRCWHLLEIIKSNRWWVFKKNTWLLTITGWGANVVRLCGAAFTVFALMFNGNIICEGATAGWVAAHLCSCFSAVFFESAEGVALVSFWLVAVETQTDFK